MPEKSYKVANPRGIPADVNILRTGAADGEEGTLWYEGDLFTVAEVEPDILKEWIARGLLVEV